MELTNEEINKAINIAITAKNNAFTLHFEHKGACVITLDKKYFGGCNIETDISGLGICAERCAIDHAVVNGEYRYSAIVVFDSEEYIHPCGVCLQYLLLFNQLNTEDLKIISAKGLNDYKIFTFDDLIPITYISDSNTEKLNSYKEKKLEGKVTE